MEPQDKHTTQHPEEWSPIIDEVTLRRLSVDEGVPLGTIEKDLALTCALYTLSESSLRNYLVFKGGTAIKKIYQPNARFSEDLDFTVTQLSEEDALDALSTITRTQIDSIQFGQIKGESYTRQGREYQLGYTGPLEYPNSIRLDFSFRKDVIEEVEERKVSSIYGETLNSRIKALSFTEIMSEKLRAMMTRETPRDYYDAWIHLPKIPDKQRLKKLVKEKCDKTGYKYDPASILNPDKLERIDAAWKIRLQHLIPECPQFRDIIPGLKTRLSFLYNQ
ncbi:MAG: nucleotidyl transferase AbiEii/AbiGii toxin family protein [Candidatus Bathyarchaeia archaeon]